MRELLALSEGLPSREVEAGGVLVREGERSGALYVLERGALTVARAGVTIAVISAPGSLVGEVAVLVEGNHSATVTATIPSAVRVAEDGEAFLRSSPEITLLVAKEVAHRMQGLVAYVAELKVQYDDGPGLEVMDEILARLSVWRTEALEARGGEGTGPPALSATAATGCVSRTAQPSCGAARRSRAVTCRAEACRRSGRSGGPATATGAVAARWAT